jgi:hypothetical protein
MNAIEWERLTAGRTPLRSQGACLELARCERDRATAAYASICGADVADAPKWDYAADLYCLLGAGADPDEAWDYCTQRWLRYAEEQRGRVDAAPRVSHGPSAGHSVIAHRWVSDDLRWAEHVVQMVARLEARAAD